MQPIPVWPINFYCFQWDQQEVYREQLKQLCHELEDRKHVSGVASSIKQGLYESAFDFCQQDNAAVQAWSRWAKDSVFKAVSHACRGQWPQGKNVVIELHESWCHITRDGGYHDVHIHANSSWSAIYYLDPGDMNIDTKNGVNRFYRPFETAYTDAGQAWMTSNNTLDINPMPGMMLLFPSWIQHSGLLYRGNRPRYILSFNSRVNLV